MSDTVITVENLSKSYVIGRQRSQDDGLRHVLQDAALAPWRWLRKAASSFAANGNGNGSSHLLAPSSQLPAPCSDSPPPRSQLPAASSEEFWALRGVNLEVKQGEVVGIIGRNGAGKSTLLKILSRITEPAAGRIHLKGRVASLLEVGTGFHPELTGRENIFLNGAILGMSRLEIKRKFDEIVAFASLEKFLDTPVKRYSSGMYVRLAFAVAAHLEPEILIVDEVLAVGDAEFQKKCLDKMDDVGHTGRTVLFVSHNMQAITRLCRRCVLLENGIVRMDGSSHRVAGVYMSSGVETTAVREWADLAKAPGDDVVRCSAVRVRDESGEIAISFDIRRPIAIELEYEVLEANHLVHPVFVLKNEDGILLFAAQDLDPVWRGRRRPVGRYTSTAWVPGNFLAEGTISVTVCVLTLEPECLRGDVRDAVLFRIVDNLEAKDTSRGEYPRPIPGVLRPMLRWETCFEPKIETAFVT
jgi:lipopolysaccharide transport system ATP-binding protein